MIIDNKMQQLIDMAKSFNKQEQLYPQLVEYLIRQRYTISQELAIHRQRTSKKAEFNTYNTYCEDCKAKAKELLNLE